MRLDREEFRHVIKIDPLQLVKMLLKINPKKKSIPYYSNSIYNT